MKRLFTLVAAAAMVGSMSAQKMQVKSGGKVVFERNVNAVEEVTFQEADPEAVEVAFTDARITMELGDTLDLADILLLNNVELDAVKVSSGSTSVVAVEDGKLLAKGRGKTLVTAIASGAAASAKLTVNVESTSMMYVEDVFDVTGRGTVSTGVIKTGNIITGQPLTLGSIYDEKGTKETVVKGIEVFRKTIDYATVGDNVGLLLRGIEKTDVARGDVLLGLDNTDMVRSKKIKGTFYLYTKDEGGRHTPIFINYRPQLYVGGTSFTIQITDLGTIDGEVPELVFPGSTCENMVVEVQPISSGDETVLVTPYTYLGQELLIRESSRTIGILTVTGYGE